MKLRFSIGLAIALAGAPFLTHATEGSGLTVKGDDFQWPRWQGRRLFPIQLVEAAGTAVGYAKVGPPHLPFEPRGTAVELRQFYLVKDWQGHGLADEMMRWVLGEAESRNGDDLYLSVFVDNHRARKFYERWGFIAEGRYAFMVGNHADEDIVMRRPL